MQVIVILTFSVTVLRVGQSAAEGHGSRRGPLSRAAEVVLSA